MTSRISSKNGAVSFLFISLMPLIIFMILLLGDICCIFTEKYRLEAVVEAALNAAEESFSKENGEPDHGIVRKICIENCGDIENFKLKGIKDNGVSYAVISAGIDVKTNIIKSNAGKNGIYIDISRKRALYEEIEE